MADEKITTTSPEVHYPHDRKEMIDPEIGRVEHAEEEDVGKKDHMDYNRVDSEIAKYASDTAIEITPEQNSRLKRLVNRRVLTIMIFTYFLQALDKGTM